MVDGKVCTAVTGTPSAARCYLCNASPVEMNDLSKVCQKEVKRDFLSFGISSLHAWICSMEWILHLAYNLPFKKWSASLPEDKGPKEERKREIQSNFKDSLGLLVDVVKQGAGTTNDGNTARIFFRNFSITAQITGIDENLIHMMYIILVTIASGEEIHTEKFAKYAKDAASLYVSLYGWYYMPSTVHKILIHGEEIIQYATVPIGKLSEEASEARHKGFRNIREHHTRNKSRVATNEDI